jgi:hypothetical protein
MSAQLLSPCIDAVEYEVNTKSWVYELTLQRESEVAQAGWRISTYLVQWFGEYVHLATRKNKKPIAVQSYISLESCHLLQLSGIVYETALSCVVLPLGDNFYRLKSQCESMMIQEIPGKNNHLAEVWIFVFPRSAIATNWFSCIHWSEDIYQRTLQHSKK